MELNEAEARGTIHELNNTLTVILSAAELLADDAEEGTQTHNDALTIRESAMRARQLIDELRQGLQLT